MSEKSSAKQMSFFQLGPQRLELARRDDGLIYLTAYSGEFPVSLSLLASSHPMGEWLLQLLGDQPESCLVPLSRLAAVKAILTGAVNKDDKLQVKIDRFVNAMQQIDPTDAPTLSYGWSVPNQLLTREAGISYHGQGWFASRHSYWQWVDLSDQDDFWLAKANIRGSELLAFLRDVLPNWQDRELLVQSDLSFFHQPLQRFSLQTMAVEQMELSIKRLEVPDQQSVGITDLPGFALVQDVLRPGLADSVISQFPQDGERLLLSGEQIPCFLRQLGQQKTELLFDPEDQLTRCHRLYQGNGRLILLGQREERRGIGTVHVVPTWQLEEDSIPATEVSKQLERSPSFLRLPHGWATPAQAGAAGIGRFGRAIDGYSLDPISLTPLEVLWRGSPRLEGPWEDLEFSEVELPGLGDPAEVAGQHLRFLTRLGLPGGILGTVNRYAEQLLAFLDQYVSRQPEARVLIIGTKTVLNYLSRLALPGKLLRLDQRPAGIAVSDCPTGLTALTPNWLERAQGLEQIDWDIILVINADSLIKSRSSALYRRLHGLHKLLFLGLFTDLGFRQRSAARAAMAELMEIDDVGPQLLWRFLLRDPEESPRELVPPHQPARWKGRTSAAAEYEFSQAAGTSRPYATAYQAEQLVNAATYLAEQLRGKKVLPVPFVEYYHPRPSFNSMNSQQLSWYIYWRDQIRQGEYLDTGLDYITLYGTELLNRVDVNDAQSGYQQLHQLWRNYRERFPSLDHSLLHWLVDYLLENRLDTDPLTPYREALAMGGTVPAVDQLLQPYVELTWSSLPLELLNCLSNYQLQRSRFFQSGHAGLLEQATGIALQTTDGYYRATFGQGIWQFFRPRRRQLHKRRLFQNAPYYGKSRLINFGSAFPYSEQAALRALITAVIKHTENILRQRLGYRGKLRTYQLPADLTALIEQRLSGVNRTVRPAPRRIKIDLQQVRRLTEQSNEVRDLLLSLSADAEDPPVPKTALLNPEPALAKEDNRAELALDEWEILFSRLNEIEIRALRVLSQKENEEEWYSFCRQTGELPQLLLDRLNAIALEAIGDLLLDVETDEPQILPEYGPSVQRQLEQLRGV